MTAASGIRNAMSVDLEDYYQVSAFEPYLPRERWDSMESRVTANTERTLDLFRSHGIKATFFVLGCVASRHPGLIRLIGDQGHEVASHGFSHVRATQQNAEEFREDVSKTKKLLEDITGRAVLGYRAASFSIDSRNLWAFEVLKEAGYEYSSSVYPVRHDHYGMPEAPRFAFRHRHGGILEVPVTTVTVNGRNFPCGGGGYFRVLPYAFFRWGLRRVNRRERQPAVFYFHPWEIDPGQPVQRNLDLRTRFRHYTNLTRMAARIDRVLRDFAWSRVDDVFSSQISA